MKWLREKRIHFSIRRLSIGVASVAVGCVISGVTPMVHAEETASDVIQVSGEESSLLDSPEETADKEYQTLETESRLTETNEVVNELSDEVALPKNENATTNAVSNEEVPSEDNTEDSSVGTIDRSATHLGEITQVVADENDQQIIHIRYATGQEGKLSFYNDHVIRYHVVAEGKEFSETPEPSRVDRPAHIVVKNLNDYPKMEAPTIFQTEQSYHIATGTVSIELDKRNSTLKILNTKTGKVVLEEAMPLDLNGKQSVQTLKAGKDTYYFGGGTQNGRFSHKGESIHIVNENNWVDGGVASPNPFYWTTDGYGVLRHTFQPGKYDFEKSDPSRVTSSHMDASFDAFYFVNDKPTDILRDYYELTGKPVVLPLFALYEGHLNAYNRDYWVEVDAQTHGAVYFEELGKWYKEFQPSQLGNREGIRETLNGQPSDVNYAFTARAVLERYKNKDMPLGWMLVNDGYGAGYGQTGSLEGNIQNLREFSLYAEKQGVETGLWTQSDLHPNPSQPAVLQRDLPNEVAKGLVRILKTDVAWVGPGYSFGLNGLDDAAKIMVEKGDNARPFIITLDGWGGTQRYAGIWTGDQTGGDWEYIRFHIPTYIGTGLSGNPNVSSDVDGIFGGGNKVINLRDFQWKTFTPMQLNMDGWGLNPKTPFAFDQTTTDINRTYLKLKSTLVPYSYSVGHEAANGKPILRAMFLDFPDERINYTNAVKYQFMYGDNFLIAPVYEAVQMDADGNDIRNGIYLPSGATWIDYFTGKVYQGGQMLNHYDAPAWKLPIFVKNGAIIPVTKAHNNVTEMDQTIRQVDFYPNETSEFTLIEDDGKTQAYLEGKVAKTRITSQMKDGKATLTVGATESQFAGYPSTKSVQFNVNVATKPSRLRLLIGGQAQTIQEVTSLEAFEKADGNVYYYDERPNLNQFSTEGGAYYGKEWIKNPVLRVKTKPVLVTEVATVLEIDGFEGLSVSQVDTELTDTIAPPVLYHTETENTPTSIAISWDKVAGAEKYELLVDGVRYTNVMGTSFIHKELKYGSTHHYRVRAIIGDRHTDWSDDVQSTTKSDPYEQAIEGIHISSQHPAQGGTPLKHLVDKKADTLYHSSWTSQAVPEILKLDLGYEYELDRLEYLPRQEGTNGIITECMVLFSTDGVHWKQFAESVKWSGDKQTKVLKFPTGLSARYLALQVTGTVSGQFVSGQELYVFPVEGSKKRLVGDVTGDGVLDHNDLTSLTNYAGLRRGIDRDFEGYVEVADLNENDLIDAYDVYYVTHQLGDGTEKHKQEASGKLVWSSPSKHVLAGEEFEVQLHGQDLANVEAINACLPVDSSKYELLTKQVNISSSLGSMETFSRIRTHGNSEQEVIVLLANRKTSPTISGNHLITSLRLRALVETDTDVAFRDLILVGSDGRPVTDFEQTHSAVHPVNYGRITVTGENVYESGHDVDKLIDGKVETLTELKWDWAPNHVDGRLPAEVTLPQDIVFDFTNNGEPTYLDSFVLSKRTPGNGTLTKYKVQTFRDGKLVHTSDEITVPFEQDTVRYKMDTLQGIDRLVLTVLEARSTETTINNRMLTLKEIQFFEADKSKWPSKQELRPVAYTDEQTDTVLVLEHALEKDALTFHLTPIAEMDLADKSDVLDKLDYLAYDVSLTQSGTPFQIEGTAYLILPTVPNRPLQSVLQLEEKAEGMSLTSVPLLALEGERFAIATASLGKYVLVFGKRQQDEQPINERFPQEKAEPLESDRPARKTVETTSVDTEKVVPRSVALENSEQPISAEKKQTSHSSSDKSVKSKVDTSTKRQKADSTRQSAHTKQPEKKVTTATPSFNSATVLVVIGTGISVALGWLILALFRKKKDSVDESDK